MILPLMSLRQRGVEEVPQFLGRVSLFLCSREGGYEHSCPPIELERVSERAPVIVMGNKHENTDGILLQLRSLRGEHCATGSTIYGHKIKMSYLVSELRIKNSVGLVFFSFWVGCIGWSRDGHSDLRRRRGCTTLAVSDVGV